MVLVDLAVSSSTGAIHFRKRTPMSITYNIRRKCLCVCVCLSRWACVKKGAPQDWFPLKPGLKRASSNNIYPHIHIYIYMYTHTHARFYLAVPWSFAERLPLLVGYVTPFPPSAAHFDHPAMGLPQKRSLQTGVLGSFSPNQLTQDTGH